MAKDKLTDYDPVAVNNTDIGGISLAEGVMVPSDLNNALREVMSHLADFADGTTGVDVLTLQDDDASASIKLQAPSEVTTTTTLTLPDGDGSNGQVISTNGSGTLAWTTISEFSLPSGLIFPYGGATAPSGYLLCFGQAISRTTYADLFTALGTTYGSGDGSTTFNVPDLRGRVIAGQDDMGGTSANRLTDQSGGLDGDTLGATGGAETHTLTGAESGTSAHGHTISGGILSGTGGGAQSTGLQIRDDLNNVQYREGFDNFTVANATEADASSAHNNVQPTIVLNYIIKT
jgi:microcystin-dependent protein